MKTAARSERLRQHLRRHNRTVLWLAAGTALASLCLWGALFLIVRCVALVVESARQGFIAEQRPSRVLPAFATAALALCIIAWSLRRLRPNEAPRDNKSAWEHALDFALAVPRATLAVYGTCSAAARLTDAELERAQDFIELMDAKGGAYPAFKAPVDLPDERTRHRVLMALQLSGVIEARTTQDGAMFAFTGKAARLMAQPRVRIRL